jgi:multiple antibiotic resistance protein
MSPFLSYMLVTFGSILSIVDPFAAVPIFLALTAGESKPSQSRTALRAALTCFVVLTSFGIAGSFIFSFFGITIPAFKVAGGILLFAVGLDMMNAHTSETRTTREEQTEAETKSDIGLIPLGLPLLSGPGAIATVMVLVGKADGTMQRLGVHLAVFAVSALTFFVLRSASYVTRVLGKTGINVVGRIMGLILAAVAMQFIFDGLREAFPRLFGQ